MMERISSTIEPLAHPQTLVFPSENSNQQSCDHSSISCASPLLPQLQQQEVVHHAHQLQRSRQVQLTSYAGLLVVVLDCVGQLTRRFPHLSKATLDCLSEFLLNPSPTLSRLNRIVYRNGVMSGHRSKTTMSNARVWGINPFFNWDFIVQVR